jgi:hypothetical protein
MAIYQNIKARGLDVSEVFSAEAPPPPEVLCQYTDDEDRIKALSNTFTIVMNRDIRKSVEIANEMALLMARKFPDQKVLLINTYAGTELMQRTLANGMAMIGLKLPPEFAPYLSPDRLPAIEENAPPPFPTNLRILDAPTGTLETWHIDEQLKLMSCGDECKAIVILNSFECAVWGYWRDRKVFAEQLVELRERRQLTFVVFSHEIRADVQIHTPAHGGIGIISAFAGSVWYLMRQADRAKFNAYYKRIASLTMTNRTHAGEASDDED